MFLFILAVLIFSMLFGHYFMMKDKSQFENFNNYGFGQYGGDNAQPITSLLSNYSSTTNNIYILYDSILFDFNNGNLIEVYDTISGNAALSSQTSNISKIWVTTRFNQTITVDMTTAKPNADKWDTTIKDAIVPFVYNTNKDNPSTEKYNVVYVPFGQETYIHIIGTTSTTSGLNQNLLSFYASKDANLTKIVKYTGDSNVSPVNIISSNSKRDNINGYMFDGYYSKTANLYSLNEKIFYDCDKGVICITDSVGTSKFYDRITGTDIGSLTSTYTYNTKSGEFNSWMTHAEPFVLCMTCGDRTAIIYLTSVSTSANSLTVNNYVLLNKTLTDGGNQSVISTNTSTPTPTSSGTLRGDYDGNLDDILADDPTLFFATCGSDKTQWNYNCMQAFYNIANPNIKNSDYIKKTEIVPPVCPMCPNCPGSGVCTYCGGAGGSGCSGGGYYVDASGNRMSSGGGGGTDGKKIYTKVGSGTLESSADPDTLGGALTLGQLDLVAGVEDVATTGAGVINKTVDTAGNFAGKVVDNATGLAVGAGALVGAAGLGAYDLAKGAGQGTYDLAKGAGQGTYDLAKGAGQGAYDLTTGAASGANSLIRDTGSGIAHLGDRDDLSRDGYYNNSNNVRYGQGGGGQGGGGQGGGQGSQGGKGGQPIGANAVDNYSYYGALPSKGNANFIPVTADFSSFRK